MKSTQAHNDTRRDVKKEEEEQEEQEEQEQKEQEEEKKQPKGARLPGLETSWHARLAVDKIDDGKARRRGVLK
ncbi:hypothetical protein UVI_02026460 [Ustilaginoidea virens]|uniref:Uncharacterized protein n=1 Tax=Ustilaginoidea virens TaxID=1159556 RepID=A0A1B5L3W6_USTVR|nr:hypothetical protein UVI_02026460 [Ustilaginoidea virens]